MPELEERLRTALADRYALERELGRGGMAVVFLARDPRHDRAVAIKVLRHEIAAALGAERFLREIQFAAKLQHPHILPLYDSGAAGDLLYYVMPYVEGESLRQRLDRETQLPLDDALAITRQVASALAYAHRHDVVHRDIKPENILLESGEAVVADFGIARAITAAGGDNLTQTGMAIGTPLYMSPEQALGEGALDGRSDLYSLGCVLYEMLAGHPPFLGGTAQAILARHTVDPVPPLRTARATVPAAVELALGRALAKLPADRYATALQFAEALGGPGRSADPPAGGGSRRLRVALGVGLALVALGAGLVLRGPWRHAPQAAVSSPAYAASVAVLPFETIGGGPEDEYFSDGMTDEIITQLAQIRDLKVISRTSVVSLKGSHLTLSQIADTLGVDHVLEGSARRAGGRVRVNAQLIAAKTDAHLWAKTYERDLKDVFRVQEEIAADVSRALLASVQGLRPRGAGSRTERPAAYDAYLRGTYWRQQRTRDGLLRAMQAFEQALAIDSAYAPAYAGLSSALSLIVNYQYDGGPEPIAALARAIVLADRAIALDSNLAEGFSARAFAFVQAAVSSDAAVRDVTRAVALRPNSGEGHAFGQGALSDAGRADDSFAAAQMATELDPLAPGFHLSFSNAALVVRRYDVALREARRAGVLETAPLPLRIRFEGLALLLLGRPSECLALDLSSQPYLKAMCLEALGRHREAAAIVDSLAAAVRAGGASWAVPEGLGMYYAWVGDVDESLHWYGVAPRVVWPRMLRSGLFDRVRDDARFRAGIERLTERNRARLEQAIVQARARRP
jgi:eukaryotic-like serine/threonine-protein kinase